MLLTDVQQINSPAKYSEENTCEKVIFQRSTWLCSFMGFWEIHANIYFTKHFRTNSSGFLSFNEANCSNIIVLTRGTFCVASFGILWLFCPSREVRLWLDHIYCDNGARFPGISFFACINLWILLGSLFHYRIC